MPYSTNLMPLSRGMSKAYSSPRDIALYLDSPASPGDFSLGNSCRKPEQSWLSAVERYFPQATPMSKVFLQSASVLSERGYTAENTLLTYSLCRDEINKASIALFEKFWGEAFDFAGLAGFPMGGVTAFGAYASHIRPDGKLLVIYGPHIGVTPEGEIGMVNRPNMSCSSTSCGALVAILKKFANDINYKRNFDPTDAELCMLEALYTEKQRMDALRAQLPIVEMTNCMYNHISSTLHQIVEKARPAQEVALLGGIQINTPEGDYFQVRNFEIIGNLTRELSLPQK